MGGEAEPGEELVAARVRGGAAQGEHRGAAERRGQLSHCTPAETAETLMLKAVQTYLFYYFTCVLISN